MMADHNSDAVVNRDEPLPILLAPGSDSVSSDSPSRTERLKHSLSASKLKDKLHDVAVGSKKSDLPQSQPLQDRLFSKLLQQVIPSEDLGPFAYESDLRSTKYTNRPGFSIPLMTNNFRRFNARIGVVFVFQHCLIRLLTWKKTSHTLSFLAVYSFVCLDPYLLAVLPPTIALFFLLVPAYLTRHPPPPSPNPASQYSLGGPPLAPPRTIKPASEMSKDFFRNMRDLQNSMDDFSTLHDAMLSHVTPWTNFSNEPLSTAVFLVLFISTLLLFISSHLLPWRFVALIAGHAGLLFTHPNIQAVLTPSVYKTHVDPKAATARSYLDTWIAGDIVMDSPPEKREVEIFELQRRIGYETFAAPEWEAWIFSPNAWEPTAPARIAGERVKGTRFFEDVQTPRGWEWDSKKWDVDLDSWNWVEERGVGGVEVEIEGERWVYDVDEEAEGDNGVKRRGEWRRRRWIRTVRRKVLGKVAGSGEGGEKSAKGGKTQ